MPSGGSQRCSPMEKAGPAGRDVGWCRCPVCPARSKQVVLARSCLWEQHGGSWLAVVVQLPAAGPLTASCALQLPGTWAHLWLLACKSDQGAEILKDLFGHLTRGSAPKGSCLLQVCSWVMMLFYPQRIPDSASPLWCHPFFSKAPTVTASSALWTAVWGYLSIRDPLSISDHWVVFFSQLVRPMFMTTRGMIPITWLPSKQLPCHITQRSTFTARCSR